MNRAVVICLHQITCHFASVQRDFVSPVAARLTVIDDDDVNNRITEMSIIESIFHLIYAQRPLAATGSETLCCTYSCTR